MEIRLFRLERYFAQYEFSTPYLLCCSDCESFSVAELFQFEPEAQGKFLSLTLGYTESLGNPELRQEIISLYETLAIENILVHAGAEEVIFNFMNVALKPQDQIIVHTPCYQSLQEVAISIGAEVVPWCANPEKNWELDLEVLKQKITSKTKVVVLNVPHNPTGYLPSKDFLLELSKLSEQHGFIIFSDEVYRGLEYNPSDSLPSFADLNERAVSLGVLSKTYGLPGLRIGWLATKNQAIYEKMASFKDYTTICNSAPSEFLGTLALRHHQKLVERNLKVIQSNLELLERFFQGHQDRFTWNPPKAGPIAFPKYLGRSVENFCQELVRKAGVLLLPGTLYGDYPYFRIGFGRKNFKEGLDKLDSFLHNSNQIF